MPPQSKYCQSALPAGPQQLSSSAWLKVMMISLQVWQAAPQSRSLIRWLQNHRLQPTFFFPHLPVQPAEEPIRSLDLVLFSERGAGIILLPSIDCGKRNANVGFYGTFGPGKKISFSCFCFSTISPGKYLALIAISVTNSDSIPELLGPFGRVFPKL